MFADRPMTSATGALSRSAVTNTPSQDYLPPIALTSCEAFGLDTPALSYCNKKIFSNDFFGEFDHE